MPRARLSLPPSTEFGVVGLLITSRISNRPDSCQTPGSSTTSRSCGHHAVPTKAQRASRRPLTTTSTSRRERNGLSCGDNPRRSTSRSSGAHRSVISRRTVASRATVHVPTSSGNDQPTPR